MGEYAEEGKPMFLLAFGGLGVCVFVAASVLILRLARSMFGICS